MKLVKRFDINNIAIITHSDNYNYLLNASLFSRFHEEELWTVTTNKISEVNRFMNKRYKTPSVFLIVVKDRQEIHGILKDLAVYSLNNKFIVLCKQPFGNPNGVVSEMMEYYFNRYDKNLKIITPDPKSATHHLVYSWIQRCGKPRQDKIKHCSFGQFSNKSLIINDKVSLKNCLVRAVHTKRPPYTNYIKGGREVKGIEENLLNTIADVLHLTMKYATSRSFGKIYPNGTTTGSFLLLQNDSADVLFGDYCLTKARSRHFLSTTIHMAEELSWCAPFRPIFGYDKAFRRVINLQLVVCAISFYLGTSFVLWCLSNLERRESHCYRNVLQSFTNNFSVLLGLSVRMVPRSGRVRLLVWIFSVATFALNTFYSSRLTSTLISSNYEERYETLNEIIQQNMTCYASSTLVDYFRSPPFLRDKSTRNLLGRLQVCSNPKNCVEKVTKNNSVFILSTLDRDYLHKEKKIQNISLIHCSRQLIHKFLLTLYVKKGFPLIGAFNRIIRRVANSGLIEKWTEDVIQTVKPQNHPEDGMIKLKHLVPVFKIYLLANGFAVLVFLAELVVGRDGGNRN